MRRGAIDLQKILYVASTESHLRRFHHPYLQALAEDAEVRTMANGEGVDYPIAFEKRMISFVNLKNICKIGRILKREGFDLIILNTSLAAFLVRASMIGWRRRPYVLNIVHGYLFPKKPRGMRERLLLLCEQMMRGLTDEIAVMNAEDLRIARKYRLCSGEVTLIDGMGFSLDGDFARNRELREQFVKSEQDLLCIYVGELSARKNQIFLLRVVWLLRLEWFPIRLVLLGAGSERESLEREIEELELGDCVTLLGNVEPVLPYLAAADLYISASRSEGLPFNVMEAMALGLPIVASDVKGQRDLLRTTVARLCRPDDDDAFCDAVKEFYQSGCLGVGAVSYKNIEKYRLSATFARNLEVFRRTLMKNETKGE